MQAGFIYDRLHLKKITKIFTIKQGKNPKISTKICTIRQEKKQPRDFRTICMLSVNFGVRYYQQRFFLFQAENVY